MKRFHRAMMVLAILAAIFIGVLLQILHAPWWATVGTIIAVVLIIQGSYSACELDYRERDWPDKWKVTHPLQRPIDRMPMRDGRNE